MLKDHLESCLFHVDVSPEVNDIWVGVKGALNVNL